MELHYKAHADRATLSTHQVFHPDAIVGQLVEITHDHGSWWRWSVQADRRIPPRWDHRQGDEDSQPAALQTLTQAIVDIYNQVTP